MAAGQNVLLTADAYRSLPEGGARYELIQGELEMAPAPNRYHQKISGNLFYLLRSYLEQRPIGELYSAPFDVYLSAHDVLQPDLIFVSNASRSILNEAGASGPPTVVIEILSAGSEHLDRTTKKRIYTANRVEELWLIDPSAKTIEVYRLRENPDQPSLILGLGERLSTPCFPGLDIASDQVFLDA